MPGSKFHIHRRELPRYLYHATWKVNHDSIMKLGLIVDRRTHTGVTNHSFCRPGIYLATATGLAVQMVKDSTGDVPASWFKNSGHMMILRVPSRYLLCTHAFMDTNYHAVMEVWSPNRTIESIRYAMDIPPGHISVVKFL